MLVAQLFQSTPVIKLRHHSPLGHFLVEPTPSEVAAAWNQSLIDMTNAVHRAARWVGPTDCNALTTPPTADPDDLPLGVLQLVNLIGGPDVTPSNLLLDVATHAVDRLDRLTLSTSEPSRYSPSPAQTVSHSRCNRAF
jgi:hypothetical protein